MNGLATETGRDRRAVANLLAGVPPDGKLGKLPTWRLATFLRVASQEQNGPPVVLAGDLADLERAAQRAQEFIDAVRAEPVIERRREMAKAGGAAIGELDRAFAAVEARRGQDAQLVSKPFVNKTVGDAISELFRLCRWQLPVA